MQSKAIVYPSDKQIAEKGKQDSEWSAYKEEFMLCMNKERWPVSKTRLRYTISGKSYIKEAAEDECVFTEFGVV